jgi:hypothetical protein
VVVGISVLDGKFTFGSSRHVVTPGAKLI